MYRGKFLKDYVTIDSLYQIEIGNRDVVEDIDLSIIIENKIDAAFENESTTNLIGSLLRDSNLDRDIRNYLVIPEEREVQLQNKIASPLFEQHFRTENWWVLYFDAIINGYLKDKINLDSFTNRNANIVKDGFEEYEIKNQIDIFSKDEFNMILWNR